MTHDTAPDIAIEFIESINRRNFERLSLISSDELKSFDEKGSVTSGKGNVINMIRDYTGQWPDFQIHINDIYQQDENVIIVGRATGSCAETSRASEIKDRLIYAVRITNGRAIEFRYAISDNQQNRTAFGIDSATRITS